MFMGNLLTQIVAIVGAVSGLGSIFISWYINVPKIEIEDSFLFDPDLSIVKEGKGTYVCRYVIRNRRGGHITIDYPKLKIITPKLEKRKVTEYSSVNNADDKYGEFIELGPRDKVKIDVEYTVSPGKLVRQNYQNIEFNFLFSDHTGKERVFGYNDIASESEMEQ